jgi:hypothetical protein
VFWLQKPSILRACVREEDTGGREAHAHATTPTYTVRRDGPAREPSWSAFWLQKPSILRACVREEDAGRREAGAPLDLKMPLENGRADERVEYNKTRVGTTKHAKKHAKIWNVPPPRPSRFSELVQ